MNKFEQVIKDEENKKLYKIKRKIFDNKGTCRDVTLFSYLGVIPVMLMLMEISISFIMVLPVATVVAVGWFGIVYYCDGWKEVIIDRITDEYMKLGGIVISPDGKIQRNSFIAAGGILKELDEHLEYGDSTLYGLFMDSAAKGVCTEYFFKVAANACYRKYIEDTEKRIINERIVDVKDIIEEYTANKPRQKSGVGFL